MENNNNDFSEKDLLKAAELAHVKLVKNTTNTKCLLVDSKGNPIPGTDVVPIFEPHKDN